MIAFTYVTKERRLQQQQQAIRRMSLDRVAGKVDDNVLLLVGIYRVYHESGTIGFGDCHGCHCNCSFSQSSWSMFERKKMIESVPYDQSRMKKSPLPEKFLRQKTHSFCSRVNARDRNTLAKIRMS